MIFKFSLANISTYITFPLAHCDGRYKYHPTVSSITLALTVALLSDDEPLFSVVAWLRVNPQMALYLE